MEIHTASIGAAAASRDGRFGAVALRTVTGEEHLLFITWPLAECLFATLGDAAHAADPTATPADGEERAWPLRASFAAAGLLGAETVQLAFRFGAMKLSVALDATHARSLARELLEAATPAATNTRQ